MNKYRYYCLEHSPAQYKNLEGVTDYSVWGSRPYIREVGGTVYGTIDFSRRLLPAEMLRYGLFPVSTVLEINNRQEAV